MSETRSYLNIKLVPKKAYKNLKRSLESIAIRLNNAMLEMRKERASISFSCFSQISKKLENQFGVEIQETFLQFMTFILKDFRSFLMPINKQPSIGSTDPNSLFDFKEFIASREKSYHQFYTLLMNTQMFTRFIEERTFFSDKYTSLAFFDECLNKIESTENADFSTFQLIEQDDRDKHDRTVTSFISDPESLINSSNYNQPYKYNKFGPFNHDLFLKEPILSHFDNHRKSSVESRAFENAGPSNRLLGSLSNLDLEQQNSTSSPMMKRTKHEVRSAQRIAKRLSETPLTWSKCLISYCYSLWFVHLHSYVRANQQLSLKAKLKIAFNVLQRMQSLDLHPLDEVCYRVLMLLAGVYNQPVLAIKILHQMKENNVVPSSISYGYYSKAVLESEWKADATDENLFWKKLRHLVQVTGYLRRLGKLNAERRLKEENSQPDWEHKTTMNDLSNVLPSLDKHDSLFSRQNSRTNSSFRDKKLNKNRTLFNEELAQKSNCIMRDNQTNRFSNLINHSEEAGLLINSRIYQSYTKDKKKIFERRRHKSEELSDQHTFNLLKIKEELVNVSSTLLPSTPSNAMISRKNFFRSQSLSVYKHEDAHTLNNLTNDLNQCKTILEQHTRTPSTASSQIVEQDNSSSNDLTNLVNRSNNLNKKTSSKDSIRRLSELSASNCSDEHINKANLQSMESLDSENSTFSPLKDAIKNMNPFFTNAIGENKVASTLRSSFRTMKSFSKSQFANSSFFKYSTSLTRQQSSTGAESARSIKNSLPENGLSSESLNNNEIKCNMTTSRSSTLPLSVSSTASNESESSKKSNSSIETESTTNTTVQPTSEMTKSHSSTDFNSIWSTKFNTNKHMDYLNSTFKFATSTAMNRLSEIKSTLSASSTSSPNKPIGQPQSASTTQSNNNALFTNLGQNTSALFTNIASMVADKLPANVGPFSEYYMADYTDGGTTETNKQQSETFVSGKFFETLEQQYRQSRESSATPILKIEITSCSRCYNCMAILYDEELMGEWSPDDSNLNATCRYCKNGFVPKLSIKVKYNLDFNSSSLNGEESSINLDADNCADKVEEEPSFKDYRKFSLAYLSPIVLRKELENVVENEGDFCLLNPQFTVEHEIIYWNLIWYFKRINLPTHLTGLYLTQFLKAKSVDDLKLVDSSNLDFRNVNVICLWDNEDLYEDIPRPLYYFWKKSYISDDEETSALVSALVTERTDNPNKIIFNRLLDLICNDNLADAIRVFIAKRKTIKTYPNTKYVYSIYRDLLFLLFAAHDRSKIDHSKF